MKDPILAVLADNPALLSEVKRVIFNHVSLESVRIEGSETNEVLGEKVRARIDGRKLVEEAFREIERHKTVKPVDEPAPFR